MKKSAGVLLGMFLLSAAVAAHAQTVNVIANEFAREAGTIAGIVEACGTGITEYNSRALEAMNTLAKTPAERQQAMTLYADALSKSQDAQSRHHTINCAQAVQAFNGLPLMKADYKTSVLPQLAKINNLPAASVNPNPNSNIGKK